MAAHRRAWNCRGIFTLVEAFQKRYKKSKEVEAGEAVEEISLPRSPAPLRCVGVTWFYLGQPAGVPKNEDRPKTHEGDEGALRVEDRTDNDDNFNGYRLIPSGIGEEQATPI